MGFERPDARKLPPATPEWLPPQQRLGAEGPLKMPLGDNAKLETGETKKSKKRKRNRRKKGANAGSATFVETSSDDKDNKTSLPEPEKSDKPSKKETGGDHDAADKDNKDLEYTEDPEENKDNVDIADTDFEPIGLATPAAEGEIFARSEDDAVSYNPDEMVAETGNEAPDDGQEAGDVLESAAEHAVEIDLGTRPYNTEDYEENQNNQTVNDAAALPLRFQQQPQIQHQGREREVPAVPRNEVIETAEAVEIPEALDHNSIPPVPPIATEYRRAILEESSSSEPDYSTEAGPDYGAAFAASPNVLPLTTTGTAAELADGMRRSPADVRRAAATGLLAGWFIGRRGKRKAVQRARNDAIKDVEARLASGPQRQMISQAAEQFQAPVLEAQTIHTYQPQETSRTSVIPTSVETRTSTPTSSRTEKAPAETQPTIQKPIEAKQVLRTSAERQPTAIPMVELAAPIASAAVKSNERMPLPVKDHDPREASRASQEMDRGELLKIAKTVKVDGVRLKDVFAAKRIDVEGLRAVVETYLRGGDVRQQLSHEIIVKEQSFERDPFLRHNRPASGQVGSLIASATTAARNIAGEQGAKLAASSQKSAKKAGRVLANGARQAQHDLIDNSNTVDWLSITAIVIVYSLILILILG